MNMSVTVRPPSQTLEQRVVGDCTIIPEPIILKNAILTVDEQSEYASTGKVYILRIKSERLSQHYTEYSLKNFGKEKKAAYEALEKYSVALRDNHAMILMDAQTRKLKVVCISSLVPLSTDPFLW